MPVGGPDTCGPMEWMTKGMVLRRVALALAALGLSLLAGELVLRGFISDSGTSSLYRIPHPVVGWVLEPDITYSNRVGWTRVSVSYNSRGWRDIERSAGPDSHVYRILVLGDSYMEAYSLPLENAFHMRLEQLAGTRDKPVETVNLGVGGYGTLQEYLVFRDYGARYHPRLVLPGFYVLNDVRNNSYGLEAPMVRDSLKLMSRPFLVSAHPPEWRIKQVDYGRARRRFEAELARRSNPVARLAGSSTLVNASYAAAQRIAGALERAKDGPSRPDQTARRAAHMAMYGVHYCSEPAQHAEGWETTRAILTRLKRDVEAAGASLFVFSVPALEEVSYPSRGLEGLDAKICWEEAPGYERLRETLNGLGVDYLDLLPAFRAAHREGADLFLRSDRHWTAAGHDLAARLVLSELEERGLLASTVPDEPITSLSGKP